MTQKQTIYVGAKVRSFEPPQDMIGFLPVFESREQATRHGYGADVLMEMLIWEVEGEELREVTDLPPFKDVEP